MIQYVYQTKLKLFKSPYLVLVKVIVLRCLIYKVHNRCLNDSLFNLPHHPLNVKHFFEIFEKTFRPARRTDGSDRGDSSPEGLLFATALIEYYGLERMSTVYSDFFPVFLSFVKIIRLCAVLHKGFLGKLFTVTVSRSPALCYNSFIL